MYSSDVAAFSRHELRFLKQLTKDVAFGVSAIRQRAEQALQRRDLEVMGDALKASEARLRTYFEASPLALFVGDSRGRFVDCNPAGLEMLGIDATTLRSMSITDLVEPGRREAARQAYETFVSTGKLDQEVRLVRPDAREVWVAIRGVQIGDDRFMAFFQDVTERRRAVDELQESERWLRLSQDIARIGHYVFDVRRNHWTSSTTLNAIFGVGVAFPRTGADWLRIVHPDDRAAMETYLGDLLARGSRFDREYRVVDQGTREVKWVHGLGELERSPDGEPVRLVGTIQDVTSRKDAEEGRRKLQARLAHSARLAAMGTLVAGVAHEVNNPLTAMTASAGVAIEDVRELQRILREGGKLDLDRLARRSGDVLEMLVEVGASAERIARIVKDLTILGRPDQRRERIRLEDVVRGAPGWLPPALAQRATVRTETVEVPDVMASAGQMEQVLVNLVVNAALSFPEGTSGGIVVRLGPGSPGMVRVEVSDDGPGIPPELTERIFEPFFTTRPHGKGTGLGLSICNAIVGAHGGTIGVTSASGKGSTFHLELPAAPAVG
jgi:PAS domain S-box-containing protein